MVYSHSKEVYESAVSQIAEAWPQFYDYLEKNWLNNESLFAGYARCGILTFDNHTNNRLERFHGAIKSVVSSSQVSVGNLVDKLVKLTNVRSVATAHTVFDQQFKSNRLIDPAVSGYQNIVTRFAFNRLCTEYSKSVKIQGTTTDLGDGTFVVSDHTVSATSCSCDRFTSFHIPCRHILYVRHIQALPIVDKSLVAVRWHVNACDTTSFGNEAAVGTFVVDSSAAPCATRGQRYRLLMTVFSSMASTLADMPRSTFLVSVCSGLLRWMTRSEVVHG